MKSIKTLALALCLVLLPSSYSNAQITYTPTSTTGGVVSVPIPNSNGTVINVGTGSAALPLQNINNNPASTVLQMGDDSMRQVPIGFTFPYWNQNFTNSYMSSNGFVNFTGNIPGAGCCSGQNLSSLASQKNTTFNYMISGIWTDLIDTTGKTTYTLGTATSRTYGWYGTNEYGTNNKNSFEININVSGQYDVRFGSAVIGANRLSTSGATGNLATGEYFQYFYGTGFNVSASSPVSWGNSGTASPNQCSTNPLSSPSCPGYSGALLASLPAVTAYTAPISYTIPATQPVTQIASLSNFAAPLPPPPPPPGSNTQSAPNSGAPQDPSMAAMSAPDPAPQPGGATPAQVGTQTSAASSSSATQQGSTQSSDAKSSSGPSKTAMAAVKSVQATNQASTTAVNQQAVQSSASRLATASAQSSAMVNQVLDMTAASSGSQQSTTSQSSSMAMFGFTPQPGAASSSSSATQTATQQIMGAGPATGATNSNTVKSVVQAPTQTATSVIAETPTNNQQTQPVATYTAAVSAQPTVIDQSTAMTGSIGLKPNAFIASTSNTVNTASQMAEQPVNYSLFSSTQSTSMPSTAPQRIEVKQEVEAPIMLAAGNLMSRTSALADAMMPQTYFSDGTQLQQQNFSVNKAAADNELSGGVSLTAMAVQPIGYQAYSITLSDTAFYAPKEIYRNQNTVDNARVLRGLTGGSDRLHQRMVDSQYKLGE